MFHSLFRLRKRPRYDIEIVIDKLGVGMKTCETFIKRSRIEAPVEEVFNWHRRSGALERLSPPWDPIQVIHRKGGIDEGAVAILKMKAGPVPYRWEAHHTDLEPNKMFRDKQVKGPFSQWIHTHRFEADGPDACILEDRIDYQLPLHPIGNAVGRFFIQQKLESIFRWRHATTAADIASHLNARSKGLKPMKVVISGAGGVVGSVLVPFLTTGGHQVFRLVRRSPNREKGEIFWDPMAGILDADAIEGMDAVIHLAGENIGEGWWTQEKKRRIVESRTRGTHLIASTLAKLSHPPEVMVSASAIGYYGDRCDCVLTESDTCGADFISDVCNQWETAAEPAIAKGIRVVHARIGVAITPTGGALKKMLPLFQVGLGGVLGSGQQYISWISIDDVVDAIYHAIHTKSLNGPVNLVAPNPVTNQIFTQVLGKVLRRPTVMKVPEFAIKLAFGEMGKEVPLSSTRVLPDKLSDSGYRFRHPDLEQALRHVLGKLNG